MLLGRARSEQHDAWVTAARDAQHSRARALADDAFGAGDYSRVLELLNPFESTLTPAERAKVAVARRKSGHEPG